MIPDIRWIHSAYGFSLDKDRISVPRNARGELSRMYNELNGTDALTVCYIAESAPDDYATPEMNGKLIAAVRVLTMPPAVLWNAYPDLREIRSGGQLVSLARLFMHPQWQSAHR